MGISQKARVETHQQQLVRLRAEVDALRRRLKEAQRLAAVGTMAAMVAHEFNNILTPIVNYAQLAQRNPSLAEKALARAAEGGQRASSICKAILGIARSESAAPEEVNIEQVVSQTLVAMGRDPKRDGVEVVFESPADMTIRTHRVELQQVLLNLLLNARTAVLRKDGPRRIEISAVCAGGYATIRVADNGVGIPRTHLKRIFEPFFTTKSSGEGDAGGSGLGLAICREIVTALGGEISVESTRGVGTTFAVRLPLNPSPTPQAAVKTDIP